MNIRKELDVLGNSNPIIPFETFHCVLLVQGKVRLSALLRPIPSTSSPYAHLLTTMNQGMRSNNMSK